MIPNGKYQVRAVDGALVTKKSGAIGVDAIVEIAEGEHAGARLRWYGHLVGSDGNNSEYAQRVIESLRYLGWSTDDLSDLSGLGSSIAIAVVENVTNAEGKTFAEVKWINALSSGPSIAAEARLQGTAAKQLGQRFAALARGTRAAQPKPAAGGTRPQQNGRGYAPPSGADIASAFGDDDIGF